MADFKFGDNDLDEYSRAASAFPDLDDLGAGSDFPAPAQPTASAPVGFSFDLDDAPPTEVKVTGDEELDRFESAFPEIEAPHQPYIAAPPVQTYQTPSFTPSFAPQFQQQQSFSTPAFQPPEEEPEVIKQWREKQAAEIRARDEASAQRRQETVAKAERSIDEFYEEYNAKKERNIKANKISEQEFVSTLSESLSSGTTWSRIADLIDLQNSQSKTLARTGTGTSDLARFKEVILRLRKEGTTAPGAAGY